MTIVEQAPAVVTDRSWRPVGWLLSAVGLLVIFWWVSIWNRVDALISNHLDSNGPLPESRTERSLLYGSDDLAERQLSADLDIAGVYPWGRLPLVIGAVLFLAGWLIALGTSRRSIIWGTVVSMVLFAVPLVMIGDSLHIALDILE